jgi:hypothetical protein
VPDIPENSILKGGKMEKYGLGWRVLKEERAEQVEMKQTKKEFLIFLVIALLITVFFIGLQIGTAKGIEQGREAVIKELSDLLRQAPVPDKENGFMPLPPSPKPGEIEEKEVKI